MRNTPQLLAIRLFLWMAVAEWLARLLQQWAAKGVPKVLGFQFVTGMRHMKQFAHNIELHCYQCSEVYSYISSIQK